MEIINVDVNVEFENEQEETVTVEIDMKELEEYENSSEKITYIEEMAKKQYLNITKVNFTEDDLRNVYKSIDNINDPSDWHPNETYDEFMEHENLD